MTQQKKKGFGKETLPFNPVSDVYHTLNNGYPISITPRQARYILANHNGDNRPISKVQVNKIYKSIQFDNFYEDGQSMTFNKNGDLTEKQHTLKAIAKFPDDRKFNLLVTVGVEPDTFQKSATAKTRTPKDELQRKYPTTTPTDYATLSDICRRKGIKTVTLQNVVPNWKIWGDNIHEGLRISDEFWSTTQDSTAYTQIKKTVNAFCTLAYTAGLEDEVTTLLEYLAQVYIEDGAPTTVVVGFDHYFSKNTVHLHNTPKGDLLFKMLCVALDLIIEREDGLIRYVQEDISINDEYVKDSNTFLKLTNISPIV